MFCSNCGEEINEKAIVCPKCGCATSNYVPKTEEPKVEEKNGMAIAGFVCSFFVPILGWVFGGIGLARAKKRKGKHKALAIAAIVIASAMFILNLILQNSGVGLGGTTIL